MQFLVEKMVNDLWIVSQRHNELWRAKEIAAAISTPNNPTRIVDLKRRKVVHYNGGFKDKTAVSSMKGVEITGGKPDQEGWDVYGSSAVKKVRTTDSLTKNDGEETKMSTENKTPQAPAPTVEVVATEKTETPKVAETPPVIAEVKAVSTTPPPGVEEMLADTDDEEETEEKKETIPEATWTGTPKVALLFSGGIFSTATLIHLIKMGYRVTPYYFADSNNENTEREQKIARGVIRICKSVSSQVESLEIVDTKITKQVLVRKRRKFVELLTKGLVGYGFNAIAYGKLNEEDPDKEEDENADTDVMFLQELTPLQVISPDTLSLGRLEDMVTPITDPNMRSMIYASTSCEDPGSRECGDCPTCLRRFRLLTRVWGEPSKTKYMKGSKVRKMKKQISDILEACAKSGTPVGSDEVQATIQQILKPKKIVKKVVEEDEED